LFEWFQIRHCRSPRVVQSSWYVLTIVAAPPILDNPTGVVDPPLNSAQIKEALGEVAKELEKKKHNAVIIAVGGAINTVLLGKVIPYINDTVPVE